MAKQGNIGVTSENIFPIIKKFLYSDHEIFLRELVSNACLLYTSLFLLPDGTQPLGSTPYMECSVGLENIFKILRIDYYRRLTYLDHPDIKKGGIRIALRFTF